MPICNPRPHQDVERRPGLAPRRGVCADCVHVRGLLLDGCDHTEVSGAQRPWRAAIIKARHRTGACGPGARLWEPRR